MLMRINFHFTLIYLFELEESLGGRSAKYLWMNDPHMDATKFSQSWRYNPIFHDSHQMALPHILYSARYKDLLGNHLMALAPCFDSTLYTKEGYIVTLDSTHDRQLGYCTSAAECLLSGLSDESSEIKRSAIIEDVLSLASSSLQPTCLYLSADNIVKNGICCRSPDSEDLKIKPIVSSINREIIEFNDLNKNDFREPIEYHKKNKEKPSTMDRGHIFFRPSGPPLEEDNVNSIKDTQNESSIKSEHDWDFDNYIPSHHHLHPTHPPLPTHPPSLTNKPWWVSPAVTTKRPFWMTKPTTIRPPTQPTRRWEKPRPTTRPTTYPTRWWDKPRPTIRPTTYPTRWWEKPKPTTRPTTKLTTESHRWWEIRSTSRKPWWEMETPLWAPWTRTTHPTTMTTTTTTTTTSKPPSKKGFCCSTCKDDHGQRITGGTAVTPHSFPWIAVLYHGSKHICGGSLIDDRHVLTAAHCVASMTPWQMSGLLVVLGAHYLDRHENSRQEVSVKTVIKHKEYSRALLYNDIAILTLAHPVKITKEVRPISLYSGSKSFAEEHALVAGWGSLFEGGNQLVTPRKVTMRIWSNEDCRDTYGHAAPGGIVPSYMCAGRQGKDACSGDSGGPIIKCINGEWSQIGIVSWGIGCGKAHYPGVYSRMSHFYPWIMNVIKKYGD